MNAVSALTPSSKKALDLVQLGKLEKAFRTWATSTPGKKRQLSRLRILLVFSGYPLHGCTAE